VIRLITPALARCVPAFEDYDNARSFGLDPGLQADKLYLQLGKLLLEFLAAHFAGRGRHFGCLVLVMLAFRQLEHSLSTYPKTTVWQQSNALTTSIRLLERCDGSLALRWYASLKAR